MPILRWSSSPERPDPTWKAQSPPVPASRTSAVWTGLWAAAAVVLAFIVFLLSSTGTVQISFAGVHGALPLAVALLIALVTGIVVTLILGTTRITQVRRLARRRPADGQARRQRLNRPHHDGHPRQNGLPHQSTTTEAGPGHAHHS